MHARVSFYDASTEGVDAGIEQFWDVTASVEQMQGNQGGMLLVESRERENQLSPVRFED
jgi:hypothetical protein